MDKERAFELIEEAKVRLITHEEAVELGEWAEREYDLSPPTVEDHGPKHVVIDWVVAFVKGTRPTANFVANFKLVELWVMPVVVKCGRRRIAQPPKCYDQTET